MSFISKALHGLGSVAKTALPYAAGAIPVVGGVVSSLAGGKQHGGILGLAQSALSRLSGGSGGKVNLGNLAGLGAAGLGLNTALNAGKQAGADASRARSLVDQAVSRSGAAADRAQQEFDMGGPLRAAFRQASLGFRDASNPFAQ